MSELENKDLNQKESGNSYENILNYVQELIPYDFAVLYRLNERTNRLEVVAQRGETKELLEEMDFRFGKGLSAWVAEWKKPILLTRKKENGVHPPVGAFLSFPLWAYGKLVGVLSLGHHNSQGFGLKELKLSRIFAERIALLMEKINFINDLKETYNSLYKSIEEFEAFYDRVTKRERIAGAKEQELSLRSKIRSPLSVIIGNAELLMSELDESKGELRKRLEKIIEASQKLAKAASQNMGENSLGIEGENKIFPQDAESI